MNELSSFLKELRSNKGKSLREASKDIGISHTYLDSLEKGFDPRTKKERNPTPDVLKKLSDYYDEPYMHLMNMAGYTDYVYDSIGEFTGLKPSEINRSKKGEIFATGSEQRIEKIYLDNVLKDKSLSVYYKNKVMTKDEKENINQLIDIHLKGR